MVPCIHSLRGNSYYKETLIIGVMFRLGYCYCISFNDVCHHGFIHMIQSTLNWLIIIHAHNIEYFANDMIINVEWRKWVTCNILIKFWLVLHVFTHDDVTKWKHCPRYWPFVRGIHRWSVNSPHKGQWRGALMFSLICAWIYGWLNNRGAGDLRRHHAHYDVIAAGRVVGRTSPGNALTSIVFLGSFSNVARTFIALMIRS